MKVKAKRRTKREAAAPGEALFCRNCGEPASQLDSFCPACGTVAEEE